VTNSNPPSNIPNPDPSVVANERLEEAKVALRREMSVMRQEAKGWIESLQLIHEEKIRGAEDKTISLDRVVQTRLAGSETALNAAMAAADKVTQKIEINFNNVMVEMKAGMGKQIDTIKESIDDMKGRLDRGEGVARGAFDTGAEQRAIATVAHSGNQNVIAFAVGVVALLGVIMGFANLIYTASRPVPLAPAVVYAQPGGTLSSEPRLQHQIFPLAPTWDNDFYRIVQ